MKVQPGAVTVDVQQRAIPEPALDCFPRSIRARNFANLPAETTKPVTHTDTDVIEVEIVNTGPKDLRAPQSKVQNQHHYAS